MQEEILVNLGWRIYRIWSTDWFKSRTVETERLMKHLDDLLTADPDYQRERTMQARAKTLRRALLALREEIQKEFPDSPSEKGLLRDGLMDELMFKRPTSKNDWLRLISHRLRAQTDSKQVGRFLPRVLEAIAGSVPEERENEI